MARACPGLTEDAEARSCLRSWARRSPHPLAREWPCQPLPCQPLLGQSSPAMKTDGTATEARESSAMAPKTSSKLTFAFLSAAHGQHCLSERSLYNEESTLYHSKVKYIIVAANFPRTRPQHSIGNFRLSFRLWILKKNQKSISKLTKNDFAEKTDFCNTLYGIPS